MVERYPKRSKILKCDFCYSTEDVSRHGILDVCKKCVDKVKTNTKNLYMCNFNDMKAYHE